MKIPFFKPYITGNETKYINDLIENCLDMSGDGKYTKLVHAFLEKRYNVPKVLLTTSGTSALELAVRLLNLNAEDEVIVPSFTFSSTVNAVLLQRGIKVVFADIKSDTLNIDPEDIKRKITAKTKAIIVVHYAGIACEMDPIMELAKNHKLKVIEDAAQAIESKYKGKYLGTIGDFGCLSFHDTKNITCGEGGALLINKTDREVIESAEIIREKGTNRSKFFRGLVDKYTWVDIGGSFLPSDILAAFLYAQLEQIDKIIKLRLEKYNYYLEQLEPLEKSQLLRLPRVAADTVHNAHIFYLILPTPEIRDKVLAYLRSKEIQASFHYIPLHSAPQGVKLGYKKEDLPVTEKVSACLLRIPLFSGITKQQQDFVIANLKEALKNLS